MILRTEQPSAKGQMDEREAKAKKLREEVERLKAIFSLKAIIDQLPFRFPSPVERSEPLRFRALSWCTYPGWRVLTDPQQLVSMTGFYVAPHLIDFSTLRAELVALTDISLDAPGQTPYDPVSLFLSKVTDTCYQPTSPEDPRPCPAQEAGKKGCDGTDPACAHVCCRATSRDAEAYATSDSSRTSRCAADHARAGESWLS
jgi:hypothetical protein